jgi:hypothetical protein
MSSMRISMLAGLRCTKLPDTILAHPNLIEEFGSLLLSAPVEQVIQKD